MLIVQSVLFFILGVSVACFLMLLLVPIIWRRALYMATKAVRMEIPLSLNEVEADHDIARAFHAVEICRMEEQVATAKTQAMAARLALDTAHAHICYLAPFEEEADLLQQKITQMRESHENLAQEKNQQNRQLEKMAALQQHKQQWQAKLGAQKSANKQLKRKISALMRQITQLEKQKEALLESERVRRKREQAHPKEVMALRQEIQQIAAMIIANIAHNQGQQSPLLQMMQSRAGGQDLAGAIHRAIVPPPPPAPEDHAS